VAVLAEWAVLEDSAVLVDMVAPADMVALVVEPMALLVVLDLGRTARRAVSGVGVVEVVALCPIWAPARAAMCRKRRINMSGMGEILVVRREISLVLSQAAVF